RPDEQARLDALRVAEVLARRIEVVGEAERVLPADVVGAPTVRAAGRRRGRAASTTGGQQTPDPQGDDREPDPDSAPTRCHNQIRSPTRPHPKQVLNRLKTGVVVLSTDVWRFRGRGDRSRGDRSSGGRGATARARAGARRARRVRRGGSRLYGTARH